MEIIRKIDSAELVTNWWRGIGNRAVRLIGSVERKGDSNTGEERDEFDRASAVGMGLVEKMRSKFVRTHRGRAPVCVYLHM